MGVHQNRYHRRRGCRSSSRCAATTVLTTTTTTLSIKLLLLLLSSASLVLVNAQEQSEQQQPQQQQQLGLPRRSLSETSSAATSTNGGDHHGGERSDGEMTSAAKADNGDSTTTNGEGECSICPHGSTIGNPSKEMPFVGHGMTCEIAEDTLRGLISESCDIAKEIFENYPLDVSVYCECTGTATTMELPNRCELCTECTTGPLVNDDTEVDLGNNMTVTCLEAEMLAPYIDDDDVCDNEYVVAAAKCCAGVVLQSSSSEEAPISAAKGGGTIRHFAIRTIIISVTGTFLLLWY